MKRISFMTALCIVLLAVPSVTAQELNTNFPAGQSTVLIPECNVAAAQELVISASDAGLLMELHVQEGSRVKEDDLIGKVDDREAKMQKEAARFGAIAAKKRAEDEINIEFTQKAHEVAQKEYELNQVLNQMQEGAVPFVEMERLKLDAERARLGAEKAIKDRELAKIDFDAKKAEYAVSEIAIDRRTVRAPTNGEVIELFRHRGEWVNPGDPILRLVQLDKLYVEGELSAGAAEPSELRGCEVTVEIALGGDRTVQASGRIIWVNPVPEWHGGQEYSWHLRAEVPNELINGDWKLHPGTQAAMTIHLGTGDNVRVSRSQ